MDIVRELGPAVDSYPTWHPLVSNHEERSFVTVPDADCGYKNLDHTRFFRNGFITCPYDTSGEADKVIESVEALPSHPAARITAEKLDIKLYHPDTTPVLVTCNWKKPLERDGTIPLSIVIPLLLEHELPAWQWAKVGETWETMRRYFLGTPHGARSSLFVNQETGQAMKKFWNTLIYTGIFGPIKV